MGTAQHALWLLLFAVSATAEPRTVTLGWKHDWKSQYKSGEFKAYVNPPEGIEKLEHDDVRYLDIELTDKRVLLVAVQTRHKPPRMWIDLNFDGKLTDEKPIELKVSGGRVGITFPLPWSDPNSTAIPTRLIFDEDLEEGRVWLRLSAHREAKLAIGGRLRRVIAVSGDANLRVDDAETDFIYIDLDGDGAIATGEGSHERIVPGLPFRIGTRGYVIEVAEPTGGALRLSRTELAPPLCAKPWHAPRRATRHTRRSRSTNQPLKELIGDYEKSLRAGAGGFGSDWEIRSIGGVSSAASVKFLLGIVKNSKDPVLRQAALEAVGYTNNGRHGGLVKKAARAAKDPERAVGLLIALRNMSSSHKQPFYAELLGSTKHDIVRAKCAEFIACENETDRAKLLQSVGSHRAPAADYFAYDAATRFRSAAPPNSLLNIALQGKDSRLRIMALADIAWVGRRDTRAEIVAIAAHEIKRKRVDPELARLVISSLGPVAGSTEIPILFACVPAAAVETRNHMIDLLRLVRDDAAAFAVRDQLKQKNPHVRATAVAVIAALPGPENETALAELLAKERERTVRIPLLTAVGRRQVHEAAPTLVALARKAKNDEELREAALIAMTRLGFGSKTIAAHFEKETRSGRWTQRLDAVDIVARYGGPDAASYLAARLADEEWRIRVAAAQGLGRIRVRESVSPLIAHLDGEQDKRVRRATADALFRITGQHLYDMHNLWIKWWSRNHSGFVVPADIPTKKKSRGGRKTVADFYGVPVESERVAFVIDQSGSMSGFGTEESSLDKAVKEVLKVIASMKNGAMVNVIFFESGIRPWRKKLVKLTKGARAKLKTHLLKQQPMGGTNLYDGLERAVKLKGVDTIYLLSDGAPSAGRFVDSVDILREIGKHNKRLRVQINCISIGVDSDLLKKLAEQSGGTYARR